jgi:hypothetical protein
VKKKIFQDSDEMCGGDIMLYLSAVDVVFSVEVSTTFAVVVFMTDRTVKTFHFKHTGQHFSG